MTEQLESTYSSIGPRCTYCGEECRGSYSMSLPLPGIVTTYRCQQCKDRQAAMDHDATRDKSLEVKRAICYGIDELVEHIDHNLQPLQVLARVRDLVEQSFEKECGIPMGSCGTEL